MDENKLKNDIKNVTAQSPVNRKIQAAKSMGVPAGADGQSTLVTGDVEGNVAEQIVDTPDRGIAFDPNSTEVYTGGTALPNLNYNTRRQTAEDRGNPLYFEPNYQPVVPYVVNTPAGSVESTTLDSQKLAWQLAVSNGLGDDRNYVGYTPVPDVGRLSWWSHFVGGAKGRAAAMPFTLAKGISGAIGTASKALSYVESPFIEAAVDLANGNPDSIVSDIIKGINLKSDSATGELFNTFNIMMDAVDDAVSPTEKLLVQSFDADPEDSTFRAQSARGVASGAVSFGVAAMTGNPELAFTLLNFANANEMRKQALSAGVAPLWAEAYGIAAPTINSALDAIQFDVYINGLGTVAGSMTDLYKNLTASGLVKLGGAVASHGAEMLGEAAVEMVQESIEGAFDPDFWANPEDRLAIAALSAIAIKGATIPVSVRHAKWEKQVELAKSLGVYDQLAAVRTATKDLVESWAKAGRINESQKNELMEMIMRDAPDKVIRDLRAGVKGQLDKIPAKDRVEFAEMLRNIDPKAVTQQEFDKLNANADAALAGLNVSDDIKTMAKGLINGVARLMMVARGTKPSEIKIPKFVLTNKGASSYNATTNTIALSTQWSNTDFTKVRGSQTSDFNPLVSAGFVPSTKQSDFMSSLIHEMGHWVDYQIGDKGFSDFLEHYYNNIATVFGNEKALAVYNASQQGGKRITRNRGEYTSERNATEYMAQALSRLGKRSAEFFGLGKSKANRFISYANLMLNQMPQLQGAAGKRNADMIARVQEAMAEVVGRNAQIIDNMIEAYGSERIRATVQEYMKSGANRDMPMAQYLMEHDMLKDLYDVLDSFADAATLNKVRDFFDSTEQIESFVTAGDTYFNTGYDNEVEAVKQRRAEAAQKAAQEAGTAPATTTAKNNVKQVTLSNGQTVSVPKNVQNFGGDKGIDAVRKLLKGDNESDRIANPNDYVAGTDPVAEVQQAFEQGKNDPVDETPSYDVEVDGRKLGEDIAGLTQGIMKRAKNLPNKVVKWAASSPWGWGLDRIMITMFGRDVAEKLDVGGKYTQRNALRSGMFNRFMKNLEPIIGNIETDNRAAMFKYKTMLNQLGFVRVKDVEINNPVVPELSNKRDLTGWEVMYVYLMKRMGEKYGNRVQQSTKTDINELIATLTDEEKQFADTMSDTLRGIWADRVGEDRAVFNYFPIMDAEHSFFDETNIDNLKARMETDSPISIEDAGRLFSKEISRMSSWESGYYRTLKRIRDVLQYKGAEGRNIDPAVDDELKRASGILAGQIKDIFGVDGYHNVLRLLDQQIADPQEQMLDSASSKTLNQMGMNVIKGLLSFKFMSLPKNMTNLAMMWGGANDQSTYWNGFAEGVSNMKRTWEYMMKHSKEIQIRYKDAGYNEFLDQRNTGGNTAPIFKGISKLFAKMDWNSDKTGGMAKMSAALDMMGDAGLKLFMLNGDAVANIYGGYGLIKDYMAQGMTEEEAFSKLDRYIVEHQSSSNLAMKPLRQLEANKSLAGQLFAFTSEGVAKWASVLGTFDEVQMGTATKSEAIANALSVAASMVLFAFLGAGVWDLWDDDDKVREEAVKSLEGAMIDQVFGATIVGNGFITPMIQNLAGVGGNTGISAPIWSVLTEGITNLKRGEYDRIATKAMEASGLLIGANALYNDIQGMMFMNADDPDLREAGFRMLAGRTPGYAEKRTGAKIRNRDNENVENSDEE